MDGPVAVVTLSRPGFRNLVDGLMAAELREVCLEIASDDAIRLAVLTGSGEAFSDGRETPPEAPGAEWLAGMQAAGAIASLTIPVIAALNGDAIDHGLELALAADLRIAAGHARFGLTDVARGRLPWDGATQRLPRLVGPAWARDMALASRIIDATTALDIGLVNRVAKAEDLAAETRGLAEEVLSGGPIAARYAKEALAQGADLSLEQGLRLEADLNIILQSTYDRAEGIRSFLEKRKPGFKGE